MANSVAIADAFRFIKLPDDSVVAADAVGDTLTLQASGGISITSNLSTDTLIFTTASGSGNVFLTNSATNSTHYITFTAASTGEQNVYSDTSLIYNPSTNVLSSQYFSGDGNSLTNLTAGNLTGTIPSTVLGNSTVYIGTTAISLNRASATQTLTGISIDGNAATANNATDSVNAGSATKSTNLAGGNNSTLLGSIPYQTNTDITTLLPPNTTTTRKFLRMTGDGTNGAAPTWDTILAADVPTLNQNTTGTAGGLSGTYLQNLVYASPAAAAGGATFRSLVENDIPSLSATKVGLGNVTNESKATMFTSPTFTGTTIISGLTYPTADGTVGQVIATNASGTLSFISPDVVNDTTPQLGGNLDLNSKDITGTGNISVTGTITAQGGDDVEILPRASGTFKATITPATLTADRTLTLPDSTTTLVGIDTTQTLTNKRIDSRTTSVSTAASITPDVSLYDLICVDALAETLTINAPIGTPVNGTRIMFRILDNGVARTLNWNPTYTSIGVLLPTSTMANKTVYVGCIYNSALTRWDVIVVLPQF